MTQPSCLLSRTYSILCGLLLFLVAPVCVEGEPPPAAVSAFNNYVRAIEFRLARQHRSQDGFLAPVIPAEEANAKLRQGELIVEQITPSGGAVLPGALLHHWRGTAFVAGAKATDFERLMRDFNAYPHDFDPEVLKAGAILRSDNFLQAWMRVRQRHVITVVMDTNYDVIFERLDVHHGYIISQSTRISEIDSPCTPAEHALTSDEEHGYLWRLNTYWSYEERDEGLYMQIESISLTRSIPPGLGWAVRPFVESVPRESLEFTLRSASKALRK